MTLLSIVPALFLIINSVSCQDDGKPTMVVEVFRHGARTLIHHGNDYFKFDEPESLLPSGQRQQYNLGKLLAKKYPHLLGSTDPRYIYARSSEPIRCTMSLQAQMFGVFEGKIPALSDSIPLEASLPSFDDSVLLNEVTANLSSTLEAIPHGFIPFTYETKSIFEEDMLHIAPWNCKYVEQRQRERMADSVHREVLAFVTDTVNKIRALGYRTNGMTELAQFGESLFTMHLQGRDAELPEELRYGGVIYNDTKFINEWFSTYYFVGAAVEKSVRMRNLMAQVIDWFQGVANGTNALKFSFLSGHETSYLALLNLYGIFNETCLFDNYKATKSGQEVPYPDCIFPEYASQVIYEIYNGTGDPYVQFLYNGKPFKICSKSTDTKCRLEDFISETQNMLLNLTKQDVTDYCTYGHKLSKVKLPQTPSVRLVSPDFHIGVWILPLLGMVLILCGLWVMVGKGRKLNVKNSSNESEDSMNSV